MSVESTGSSCIKVPRRWSPSCLDSTRADVQGSVLWNGRWLCEASVTAHADVRTSYDGGFASFTWAAWSNTHRWDTVWCVHGSRTCDPRALEKASKNLEAKIKLFLYCNEEKKKNSIPIEQIAKLNEVKKQRIIAMKKKKKKSAWQYTETRLCMPGSSTSHKIKIKRDLRCCSPSWEAEIPRVWKKEAENKIIRPVIRPGTCQDYGFARKNLSMASHGLRTPRSRDTHSYSLGDQPRLRAVMWSSKQTSLRPFRTEIFYLSPIL